VGAFSPAPPGKDYQLWFVTSESKVSAGLIKANPDGPTCTTAPISNDLPHVTVVGITLEPEGGSPSPTTPFWTLGRFN
jgi:anti-sigma-K factor RskA